MIAMSTDRPRRVNLVMLPEFIPICPTHRCDMVSYKRGAVVVYFQCPRADCKCSDKVARKLFRAVGPTTQTGMP